MWTDVMNTTGSHTDCRDTNTIAQEPLDTWRHIRYAPASRRPPPRRGQRRSGQTELRTSTYHTTATPVSSFVQHAPTATRCGCTPQHANRQAILPRHRVLCVPGVQSAGSTRQGCRTKRSKTHPHLGRGPTSIVHGRNRSGSGADQRRPRGNAERSHPWLAPPLPPSHVHNACLDA